MDALHKHHGADVHRFTKGDNCICESFVVLLSKLTFTWSCCVRHNEAFLVQFPSSCFWTLRAQPLWVTFQNPVSEFPFLFNSVNCSLPFSRDFSEQTVSTLDSLKPLGGRFCFDKLYIKPYFQSHQRLLFCHSEYWTWTAFKGSE